MPLSAFNTTLSRGGDKSHLYGPRAGWEGISEAQQRLRIELTNIQDPIQMIASKYHRLRGRLFSLSKDVNKAMKP